MHRFTKPQILRAAITLSRRYGVDRVIKKHIAEHLGCGMGTVNYHWGTMANLREAIITEAKTCGDMGLLTGTLKRT